MIFERPLDAQVAPADDPLFVDDLLDDALAGLAVLGDAQRRVFFGLELDLVAEPFLELGGLAYQLHARSRGTGEDDLTVHDGHRRLLYLNGCNRGYHGRRAATRRLQCP